MKDLDALENNIKNLKTVIDATDSDVDNYIKMFSLIGNSFIIYFLQTLSKIIGEDKVYFKKIGYDNLTSKMLKITKHKKSKNLVIKLSKSIYKIMGMEYDYDFEQTLKDLEMFTYCKCKDRVVFKKVLLNNPLIGIVLLHNKGIKYPTITMDLFLHMNLNMLPIPRNIGNIKKYIFNRIETNFNFEEEKVIFL